MPGPDTHTHTHTDNDVGVFFSQFWWWWQLWQHCWHHQKKWCIRVGIIHCTNKSGSINTLVTSTLAEELALRAQLILLMAHVVSTKMALPEDNHSSVDSITSVAPTLLVQLSDGRHLCNTFFLCFWWYALCLIERKVVHADHIHCSARALIFCSVDLKQGFLLNLGSNLIIRTYIVEMTTMSCQMQCLAVFHAIVHTRCTKSVGVAIKLINLLIVNQSLAH